MPARQSGSTVTCGWLYWSCFLESGCKQGPESIVRLWGKGSRLWREAARLRLTCSRERAALPAAGLGHQGL